MLKLTGCGGSPLIPHRVLVSSVACCVTIKGRESDEILQKLLSKEFAPAVTYVAGSADQNHNGSGSAWDLLYKNVSLTPKMQCLFDANITLFSQTLHWARSQLELDI